MKKIETKIAGVFIIEPQVLSDERGCFMETYSTLAFQDFGIDSVFVQDNQSFTIQEGTLRGLHYQNDPMAQSKLVRVTHGVVLDVAVDIRRGSPTYLNWVSVELSSQNKRMLYIPRGFAHGFVTLTDNVEFIYKVDNLYAKQYDRSIRFDDPSIGVEWGIDNPIISNKDLNAPQLKNSDCNFIY